VTNLKQSCSDKLLEGLVTYEEFYLCCRLPSTRILKIFKRFLFICSRLPPADWQRAIDDLQSVGQSTSSDYLKDLEVNQCHYFK